MLPTPIVDSSCSYLCNELYIMIHKIHSHVTPRVFFFWYFLALTFPPSRFHPYRRRFLFFFSFLPFPISSSTGFSPSFPPLFCAIPFIHVQTTNSSVLQIESASRVYLPKIRFLRQNVGFPHLPVRCLHTSQSTPLRHFVYYYCPPLTSSLAPGPKAHLKPSATIHATVSAQSTCIAKT